MPSDYESVREAWERAMASYRTAMEAQSERVGPPLLDMLTSEQLVEANMYPTRDTATAAAMRARQLGRPMFLTPEELQTRYLYPTTRQPERPPQAERRGQMTFSTKQTPLTSVEKARMKEFFRDLLREGNGSYPLAFNRLIIYADGEGKFIYRNNRWSMSSEHVYIGSTNDEGTGDLADPGTRLALTLTLMSLCDLQNDSELVVLVEQRLAKILAGVYASATAPLAERSDSEPINRIAWSAAGGVAAFVDGEWVTPVTGETIEVGEGWIVVETGEGQKEEVLVSREVEAVSFTSIGEDTLRQLELSGSYSRDILPDSRSWLRWQTQEGEQGVIAQLVRYGFMGRLVPHQHPDGRWGITYPLPPLAAQEPDYADIERRFREWARSYGTNLTSDGRVSVSFGRDREATMERILARENLSGCVVVRDRHENWAITYPLAPTTGLTEPIPEPEPFLF